MATVWPFPFSNTTIDTFNRANEAPLATSSSGDTWSTKQIGSGTTNLLKVVSNTAGANTASTCNQYDTVSYGPDMECYVTIPTLPASGQACGVYVRGQNAGLASFNGYRLFITPSSSSWAIQRFDSNVATTISSSSQAFSAGDSLGLQIIGSTLNAYYKSGSSAWALQDRVYDNTYTGTGVVGLQLNNTTVRADNFGGGTIKIGSLFPAM